MSNNLHFVYFHKKFSTIIQSTLKLHKFPIIHRLSLNYYLSRRWNIFLKYAENTTENFQKGDDLMSREAQTYIKGATAAVITGGLAYLAVRSLDKNRRFKRKATAKAFKVLGTFMDSL